MAEIRTLNPELRDADHLEIGARLRLPLYLRKEIKASGLGRDSQRIARIARGHTVSRNFDIFQKMASENGEFRPPTSQPAQPSFKPITRKMQGLIEDEVMKLVQRVFVLPGSAQAPGAVAFVGVNKSVGCSWVCAHASEVLADQIAGTRARGRRQLAIAVFTRPFQVCEWAGIRGRREKHEADPRIRA